VGGRCEQHPARAPRAACLARAAPGRPHPNTGFATGIGPEEAVALLAQGRVRHLDEFIRRHDGVPGLDDAASSKDWRWRFVAALARLLIHGDWGAVAAMIGDARPTPQAALRPAWSLRAC
jgi:hypothetical protein